MEREKIGLEEVRKILSECLKDSEFCVCVANMPDEKLMKTNLHDEFGMDSLDFEDMFEELFHQYGILVSYRSEGQYSFKKEQTVESFIDTVNCSLKEDRDRLATFLGHEC